MPAFLHAHNSLFCVVAIVAVAIFCVLWFSFWRGYYFSPRRTSHFFFDPQDSFRADSENRTFPESAKTATFEPMLKHYIGVTQLLVTVAAASIAFGSNQSLSSGIA